MNDLHLSAINEKSKEYLPDNTTYLGLVTFGRGSFIDGAFFGFKLCETYTEELRKENEALKQRLNEILTSKYNQI